MYEIDPSKIHYAVIHTSTSTVVRVMVSASDYQAYIFQGAVQGFHGERCRIRQYIENKFILHLTFIDRTESRNADNFKNRSWTGVMRRPRALKKDETILTDYHLRQRIREQCGLSISIRKRDLEQELESHT